MLESITFTFLHILPYAIVYYSGKGCWWQMSLAIMILSLCRFTSLNLIQLISRFVISRSNWRRISSSDIQPDQRQLIRESSYNEVIYQSNIGIAVIYFLTNMLDNPFNATYNPASIWYLFKVMGLIHIFCVEPIYYYTHRWLHENKFAWKNMHSHHHLSIHPEPLTGNVQNHYEHIIYTLCFAPPIILPYIFMNIQNMAWYAYPLYICTFDFLNSLGHINIEIFPKWWGFIPFVKYCFYTPTFHTMHHTKFNYNFCLFMPIWDYLHGTVHPDYYKRFQEAPRVFNTKQQDISSVFLINCPPAFGISGIPYFANGERLTKMSFSLEGLIKFPLSGIIAPFVCGLFWNDFSVHRYNYKYTNNEIWTVAQPYEKYIDKENKRNIQIVESSIKRAIQNISKTNAKVVGLGWLTKAGWINDGGLNLINSIPKGSDLKIVHGNTLTTAVIIKGIEQHFDSNNVTNPEIVLIGSTSKIGVGLIKYFTNNGTKLKVLTRNKDRYEEVVSGLSDEQKKNIDMLNDIKDIKQYRYWCRGKDMRISESLIPKDCVVFDYTVLGMKGKRDTKVFDVGHLKYNDKDSNITFTCGKDNGKLFSCHAGSIVHTLENWQHHELGPIKIEMLETVWNAAKKNGFYI